VVLPRALFIRCLRFLFAEFLEARIIHLRNGAGPVEPALPEEEPVPIDAPPAGVCRENAAEFHSQSYRFLRKRVFVHDSRGALN
jgi:hypothetical protein